jgi:hypothetical protein
LRLEVSVDGYRQAFGQAFVHAADLRQVDLDGCVIEPVAGDMTQPGRVPLEQALQVDVWFGHVLSLWHDSCKCQMPTTCFVAPSNIDPWFRALGVAA